LLWWPKQLNSTDEWVKKQYLENKEEKKDSTVEQEDDNPEPKAQDNQESDGESDD